MKPLKIIPRPPAPTVLATASLTSTARAQRSSSGVSHDLIAPDRVTTLGKESEWRGEPSLDSYLRSSERGLTWWGTSRGCAASVGSPPWRPARCGRFAMWRRRPWLKRSESAAVRDAHRWIFVPAGESDGGLGQGGNVQLHKCDKPLKGAERVSNPEQGNPLMVTAWSPLHWQACEAEWNQGVDKAHP